MVSLCIDEIVDDGIILETDPVIVASRVSRPPAQDNPLGGKGIELSEQGLLNVWEFGKMKLAERMRQGLLYKDTYIKRKGRREGWSTWVV